MTLRFGVLGATSMVYEAVIRDAIDAVDGVTRVHEASLGTDLVARPGVRRSRSYEDVLVDPDVDVVYVPLPNHLHERWVVAAARAGKHVLCEKPLATSSAAAGRMIAACDAAGVVLLEAYMSPFHPRSIAVQQAATDGTLGDVRHGTARMSGVLPRDNHRWDRANGGGALWDVGIYCVEPILSAMDWDGEEPATVSATSILGGNGVDDTTSAWVAFADGRSLSLWVSLSGPDHQHLALVGGERELVVDGRHATPMHGDAGFRLRDRDGTTRDVATATGSAYEGLIAHMRDVVRGNVPALRPPSRTLAMVGLLERIADAAGLDIP